VLRYDGDTVACIADMSGTVPANLGDMVIDDVGRAYVGSQAYEGGVIVRVDPDETSTVVADDLDFPNGMVITPDRKTLIVAESMGQRLTAFTIPGSGEFFVMFKDPTNGASTYSGYRVLAPKAVAANESTVLDFNFASNPPCAYSPFTTCPLPPPENKLDVPVEAGERRYQLAVE